MIPAEPEAATRQTAGITDPGYSLAATRTLPGSTGCLITHHEMDLPEEWFALLSSEGHG